MLWIVEKRKRSDVSSIGGVVFEHYNRQEN
jgi:hypothetical protein